MKKNLWCFALAVLCCTSCASTSSNSSEPATSEPTIEKEYQPITFAEMPDNVTDAYTGDVYDVEITGYLSENVSKDGSVGYLWNTGYGTIPGESVMGTCVVLNLTNAEKTDITGDQFVTVTGSVMTGEYYDVYNINSAWHLDVDTIVVCTELPDKVQQYQDYMDSYEWEAFAKTIDFVGNAIYLWYEDEDVVELDLNILDCDLKSVKSETAVQYPGINARISQYLIAFTQYYNTVVENMNNKTRPEDLSELYEKMANSYKDLSEDLVNYSCFD